MKRMIVLFSLLFVFTLGMTGCKKSVDQACVEQFLAEITKGQTINADKATIANTKHLFRLANDKTDGKLYELITDKCGK